MEDRDLTVKSIMDSKRKHVKSQASGESSGDSSCDSPASLCSNSAATSQTPLSGGNAFANDGSFMEIFKKKMEEEQRKTETGHKGGDGSRHGQTTMTKKPPLVTNFVRGFSSCKMKNSVDFIRNCVSLEIQFFFIPISCTYLQKCDINNKIQSWDVSDCSTRGA